MSNPSSYAVAVRVGVHLGAAALTALLLTVAGTSCDDDDATVLPPLPKVDLGGLQAPSIERVEQATKRLLEDPRNAAASGGLAMLLHAFGKLPAAEPLYRRAAILDAQNSRWPYYEGLLLSELGRHAEASEAYERVLRLHPENTAAELRFAMSLESAGEASGSETLSRRGRDLLEQTTTKHPELPEARLEFARRLATAQDWQSAAEQLEAALDHGEPFREAHELLEQAYSALGDDAAADRQRALLERNRERPLVWDDPLAVDLRRIAQVEWNAARRGAAMMSGGNYYAAAREFEAAVAADPSDVRSLTNLVAIYGMTGREAAAKSFYEQVVKLAPDDSIAHQNMATIRLNQGRYSQSEDLFRRAVECDPLNDKAATGLARALEAQGRRDQALATMRDAVRRNGQSTQARMEYGRMLAERGDADGAVVQIRTAAHYSEGRQRIEIQRRLAEVFSDSGNSAAARAALDEALAEARASGDGIQSALIESQLSALDR